MENVYCEFHSKWLNLEGIIMLHCKVDEGSGKSLPKTELFFRTYKFAI